MEARESNKRKVPEEVVVLDATDAEMTDEELQEKHCEEQLNASEMEKEKVLGVFMKPFGKKRTTIPLKEAGATSRKQSQWTKKRWKQGTKQSNKTQA